MEWNYRTIAANLINVSAQNFYYSVTFEYNPCTNKFVPDSNYLITHSFTIHGRTYDRTKSGNYPHYCRLLSLLNLTELQEKAIELFTIGGTN